MSAQTQTANQRAARQRLRARVAMACKALGIADDGYRELLSDRYGVTSSTDLTLSQAADLAMHLEGYMTASRFRGRPAPRAGAAGYVAKIAGLLQELGKLRQGRERLAYADATAHEMFFRGQNVHVMVEFLSVDSLRKVIHALELQAARQRQRGGAE